MICDTCRQDIKEHEHAESVIMVPFFIGFATRTRCGTCREMTTGWEPFRLLPPNEPAHK